MSAEPGGSSMEGDGKELLKGALDSHKAITLKALDVIPPNARLTVYILWTLSLLGGVTGIVFAIAANAAMGFVIILAAFICIILSSFLQNKPASTSPEQLGELTRGQVSQPSWARFVPKIPITPEKLDSLQLALRQLRNTAVTQLNESRKKAGRTEINAHHVRINVFLVNTAGMADSGALVLIIPKKLHDNMADFRDREIKILPHEGVTGRTFTLGEASGAEAAPVNGSLKWSKVDLFPSRPSSDEWERFTLSEEQNALIGDRLRWIISFPLKYEGTGTGRDKTFSVLNIDGIEEAITVDDMRLLAASIEPNIINFAASLAALPKVRITIRVEDV